MISFRRIILIALLFSVVSAADAQKNASLAPSPPMGWNSWNYFGKQNIDENIVRGVIDAMAASGLQKAGYNYVVVDGGWRDTKLNAEGELVPHPTRFPNGIKPLADYAHSKGLKFGLHIVPGYADCGGDPVGAWGHEEKQLAQFLAWGVDILKIDLCRFNSEGWNEALIESTYRKWSELLAPTDILFSISAYKFRPWYPEVGNMARTTGDIKCKSNGGAVFDRAPVKGAVMNIAELNNAAASAAGNGYWNDPDMLAVGKQGLTFGEEKIHFALWCVMSSPLMLGNDPRSMSDDERYILLNEECIAVNQDPTQQGMRVKQEGSMEIWVKKLQKGKKAVLLLNRGAEPASFRFDFPVAGLAAKTKLRDLYERKDLGKFKYSYTATIGAHDCLFLLAE